MAIIKREDNQNIFDIALQEYGSMEGLFDFIEDNNITNINQDISAYDDLYIINTPTNTDVVDFYLSRSTKPATTVTAEQLALYVKPKDCEGIGCMEIGFDFIVYKPVNPEPVNCLEKYLVSTDRR